MKPADHPLFIGSNLMEYFGSSSVSKSEYEQEMPPSYTADQPYTPRGRHTEHLQSHHIKWQKK